MLLSNVVHDVLKQKKGERMTQDVVLEELVVVVVVVVIAPRPIVTTGIGSEFWRRQRHGSTQVGRGWFTVWSNSVQTKWDYREMFVDQELSK